MTLTTDRGDVKQSTLDVLQGRTLTSVAPFVVIAVVSEASLILPPGPVSDLDAYLSLIFLATTAALFFLTSRTLPRHFMVVVPLCYLVSVLTLILAAGGSSTGIGLVVLLPVLWAALTLDLWESIVIVVAVVILELVSTCFPLDLPAAVRLRPGRNNVAESFPATLCRGLELGQAYASDERHGRCAHFGGEETRSTYCLPLLINRETIGLLVTLVLEDRDASNSSALQSHHHYARSIGDQISKWIANFRLRETLKNLSIRDPLTNLFNRRFMIETLHRELAITTRSHEQTSIFQIDIDHFKEFNDSFGHEVGDSVLHAVADVMFGLFRESDVPCRSGGEEFTLILPRCSWEVAHDRATELQARVAALVIEVPENRAKPQPPTLSIGIATSPEHGTSSEELLRGADKAMYLAKSSGRNKIVCAALALHA